MNIAGTDCGHEGSSAQSLFAGFGPWRDERTWRQLFERMPAAVYACDADGRVIFFNAAAAELWGRAPEIGRDLWCGSWRMFWPDGSPMAMDQCPMAIALRERRRVRDMGIVIERPDGARRHLMPHPEPVYAASGTFVGAFNLLVDITDHREIDELRGRLTAIVHSSDDAIISKDLNGIITSWNSGAERLFGYGADEAIGRPIAMLIPEERIDEEPEVLARLRRGETIDHYETVRRRKDGSIVNISLTVSPMLNKHGQVIGASKIARDITERRAADYARTMLAALVQSSDDAIIGKDLNGIITTWNRGAERLFGYSPHEVIGRPISILIPPDRYREEPQVMSRIARGESIEHYETVRRHKNGALVDISLTVSPIVDVHGRIVGASKIARDISDRKRSEKATADADRRKDEFLATLAHELRNPLAPLRSSLDYLRKAGPGTSSAQHVVEVMERQVEHLVRLVDDLTEVSRITRGSVELKREVLQLGEVLMDAVEVSRPLIELRGHRLELSLVPDVGPVFGDRVRLVQVFSNLLNNAAKFTPPQGTISLLLEREHEQAIVRVLDTGVGIRSEMLDAVFEMFTQVRSSSETAPGGLGIGLSLVRRLVEMHGGSVYARSAGPYRGSEFIVQVPLAAQARASANLLALTGPDAQPLRRRMLLVDDNRDAVESMALLLESLGHEVHVAFSGEEAMTRAEEQRPEVVLLDIGMPGMSGYDVAGALRERPWGKSLRLIALTGWGQASDRQRTTEAGFDHHLVKPVEFATLERLLAAMPSQ